MGYALVTIGNSRTTIILIWRLVMKRFVSVLLMVCMILTSSVLYAAPVDNNEAQGTVSMSLDATKINEVGQIITAKINVKDIDNLSAFQINIKYDPNVLQPIKDNGTSYSDSTPISGSTILINDDYGILNIGSHKLKEGILNFARSYMSLASYKNSENGESEGTLGVIKFKALKKEATTISFAEAPYMPGMKDGVYLANWDADTIAGYSVIQPNSLSGSTAITLEADSNNIKEVGQVITAYVRAEDFSNISGYQFNIKYDPFVLQPIKSNGSAYSKSTPMEQGDILANSDYGVLTIADNDLAKGILNQGRCYTNLAAYRDSAEGEKAGILGKVQFKVLKVQDTQISFEDSKTMPGANQGTFIFDWNGDKTSNYTVNKSVSFKADGVIIDPTKLEVKSITADKTGSVEKGTTVTWTCEATGDDLWYAFDLKNDGKVVTSVDYERSNKFTYTLNEAGKYVVEVKVVDAYNTVESKESAVLEVKEPVIVKEGKVTIELDTDKVTEVGQIVKATIKASDFAGIAGYQVNLKYDPEVLQPVTASGKAYSKTTQPEAGSLLANDEFGPIGVASNDITTGKLTFGKAYSYLQDYKESGDLETDGSLAVIQFKVLKLQDTQISFEDSVAMPGANQGTFIFDANGDKTDNYTVNKSVSLDAEEVIIPPTELVIKSITADKTGTVEKGTTVTWTCEATGDDLWYAFDLKNDGKVVTSVDYERSNKFTYTLNEAGKYVVEVKVVDAYNTVESKESAVLEVKEPVIVKEGKVTIELDTDKVTEVGQIVKATIKASDFAGIAGYQVNLKYDPEVLQPVTASGKAYSKTTQPEAGSLLANDEFGPIGVASNDITTGKLTFGKAYSYLQDYKESGDLETDGSLAVIQFKVLKLQDTQISFEDSVAMPGANQGTFIFDANGDKTDNYTVNKSVSLDAEEVIIPPTELVIKSITADKTGTVEKGTTVTWTCEATGDDVWYSFKLLKDGNVVTETGYERSDRFAYTLNESGKYAVEVKVVDTYNNIESMQSEVVEIKEPVIVKEGKVTIELDTDKVTEVGQIVKATIKASDFAGIAGYQVNLKYDPEVLQPVTASGKAYSKTTQPEAGSLLANDEFGPIGVASNDITTGKLTFGKAYSYLQDYKESGDLETDGSLAVIQFKVLKLQDTQISFEDSVAMPGANQGTFIFDANGDKTDNYTVNKSVSLDAEEVIIPPTELVIKSITADKTGTVEKGTTVTWTCEATGDDVWYSFKLLKDGNVVTETGYERSDRFAYTLNESGKYAVEVKVVDTYNNIESMQSEVVEIKEPVIVKEGKVTIELDTDKVTEVGQIVKATIKASDFAGIAGYQVNLKYDPEVLQPVTASGKAYSKTTQPEAGSLLANDEFGPIGVASNDITTGKLTFGKAYSYLQDYKESGDLETDGSLAVIQFKVLKLQDTQISFEDSAAMPGANQGTFVFDKNGDTLRDYIVRGAAALGL